MVSLSNSAPQGSMFNEELRRKEQSMLSESKTFVSEYRGRSIHEKLNTRDKSMKKYINKFKGMSWTRKYVECYYCHEKGHTKRK